MKIAQRKRVKEIIQRFVPANSFFQKLLIQKRIKALYLRSLPREQVEKAERGEIEKCDLVELCSQKWEKRVKASNRRIDQLFHTSPVYLAMDENERERIRTDILFCKFAYGFAPTEYLCYRLDLLDTNERRSFISERDHMHYYYRMNDVFEADIFNDKMKTYELFKKYYHREIVSISKKEDYPVFCAFVKKFPVFVKKEVYASSGMSVEKIDFAASGKSEQQLFEELISRGKTVLEECVIQHPITAAFNPSSVNTVRVITFNTKQGMLAPYAFMKIGRAGSFVDNGGAGGILVGIDEKTGILNYRGIDELHWEYEVHPDSGVKFVGCQLPDWDQAIAMCKEMAAMIPKVGYIGWDLAYTENNKWVIIEGNGLSQFIGPQTIWQRGIKEEVEVLLQNMDCKA